MHYPAPKILTHNDTNIPSCLATKNNADVNCHGLDFTSCILFTYTDVTKMSVLFPKFVNADEQFLLVNIVIRPIQWHEQGVVLQQHNINLHLSFKPSPHKAFHGIIRQGLKQGTYGRKYWNMPGMAQAHKY